MDDSERTWYPLPEFVDIVYEHQQEVELEQCPALSEPFEIAY